LGYVRGICVIDDVLARCSMVRRWNVVVEVVSKEKEEGGCGFSQVLTTIANDGACASGLPTWLHMMLMTRTSCQLRRKQAHVEGL